ncbi:hypothetical protein N7468_006742 [Penicillium chermesinum]|uniref:Uncharacterized protein n=1 Tax=Penicillium chermesinum TaxID=63820 RepID=A0A9W9NSV3_9EURO|nr:uncharacterized protein N7468_006742 [Penicillium chermesinum]KAJ5225517.1 hypothetical protein N7468_006742 [Penicillium chermesinum]
MHSRVAGISISHMGKPLLDVEELGRSLQVARKDAIVRIRALLFGVPTIKMQGQQPTRDHYRIERESLRRRLTPSSAPIIDHSAVGGPPVEVLKW